MKDNMKIIVDILKNLSNKDRNDCIKRIRAMNKYSEKVLNEPTTNREFYEKWFNENGLIVEEEPYII